MASPISNDKILPSDSMRTTVSNNKSAKQDKADHPETVDSNLVADDSVGKEVDSVDVERASQILSQSQTQTSSGNDSIFTPDQASSAVAELRAQIAENGIQALRAQAGPASVNLSALLEAAPA